MVSSSFYIKDSFTKLSGREERLRKKVSGPGQSNEKMKPSKTATCLEFTCKRTYANRCKFHLCRIKNFR